VPGQTAAGIDSNVMNPRWMAGLAGVLLAGMTLAACGSSSSTSTGTAGAGPTTSATSTPTTTTTTSATATSTAHTTGNAKTAAITITPTQGSPTTQFKVSFTAPERTGTIGGFRRSYVAQFNSGAPRADCTAGGTVAIAPSAAGASVEATLDPAHLGNPRWCTGTFDGKVVELRAPNCAAGQVCPAYIVVVGTVGRFTFRVT
jgi:ABC-type glycerol-3-phosphate transport system substrate-binding protein